MLSVAAGATVGEEDDRVHAACPIRPVRMRQMDRASMVERNRSRRDIDVNGSHASRLLTMLQIEAVPREDVGERRDLESV